MCKTKKVILNYEKSAESRKREGIKTKKAKPILYAFRALLTAEHLALTGEIETKFNNFSRNKVIDYLLERKGSTIEPERVMDIDVTYQEQLEKVRSAYRKSTLDSTIDYEQIDELVYKIREEEWTNTN